MHKVLGARFENRTLPWHRSTTPCTPGQTALQALQAAGADYRVEKVPLTVTAFGKTLVVPDNFALTRSSTSFDPEPATLGLVSSRYAVLQNSEIAAALDACGLTEHWSVSSVGIVNAGQKLCIALEAGSSTVNHAELRRYLLVTTGHDGLTPTTISYTPVRVSCTNVMLLGTKEAILSFRMTHEKRLHTDLFTGLQTVHYFQQAQQRMQQLFERFGLFKLSLNDCTKTFETAYPSPTPPQRLSLYYSNLQGEQQAYEHALQNYNNGVARAQELRHTASDLMRLLDADGHPDNKGTAWNCYQAITELSNHRAGPQSTNGDRISNSVLFGARAAEMGRAWDYLRKLVDHSN